MRAPLHRSIDQRNQGSILVEVITAMAVVGVIASMSMVNLKYVQDRARTARTLTDYRNLKLVVLGEASDMSSTTSYTIGARTGPARLPSPLSEGRLSKGVNLVRATKTTATRAGRSIVTIRLQVSDPKGKKRYDYTSVDGRVTEQVVNLP